LDEVHGLLPDHVDPLPRSVGDLPYFLRDRRFLVTLAVALLATWLLWPTPPATPEATEAEVRVTQFLTALRDHDVDAAMDMTSGVQTGADPSFLVPSAISDDWDFRQIRERYSYQDEPVDIEVEAVLVDAEGYEYPTTFYLERTSVDEPWILREPFALVSFPVTALAYVEANGVRLPEPYDDPDDYNPPQFAMFPGSYRFYSNVGSVAEVDSQSVTLAGGAVHMVETPAVRLVDEAAAQSAIDAYVDDCAKLPDLIVGGCPFGADRVPVPDDDEYIFSTVSKVEWKVVEYPIVTVVGSGLVVTDRQAGMIELTATSAGSDPQVSVLDCRIVTDRLAIRVLPDGQLRVYPEGYAGRLSEVESDLIERRTCDV